jgi:hypothetical protein
MPYYVRKRMKIAPGVSLNLSRSGLGLSVGPKGCKVSYGPRGVQLNAGRGGLYYRQTLWTRRRRSAAAQRQRNQQPSAAPSSLMRCAYFLCIGSWLGIAYAGLALTLMSTIVGLPWGVRMLRRVPHVTTLAGVPAQRVRPVLPPTGRASLQWGNIWGRLLVLALVAVGALLALHAL